MWFLFSFFEQGQEAVPCPGSRREAAALTSPSSAAWPGQPVGTSCSSLALKPEGKQL